MIEGEVSVIIPTHNRAAQIYQKVQWLLGESCVGEVIVVVDGSSDGTVDRLQSIDDSRLKLVVNGTALGPSRARNAGMQHVTRPWVALLDDDDHHSEGFLDILVSVARDSGAGVSGAPWLHFAPGISPQLGFTQATRGASGPTRFSPSIVPEKSWVECLWVPNNVIVKSSVLAEVQFNEGYRGNFWREETDFFVSVARAGHKVVVTSRAYSYQHEKPAGGIVRSNRLLYEYWVARNDLRFMARHGAWLTQQGEIQGVARFLWSSMIRRVKPRLVHLVQRLQ